MCELTSSRAGFPELISKIRAVAAHLALVAEVLPAAVLKGTIDEVSGCHQLPVPKGPLCLRSAHAHAVKVD